MLVVTERYCVCVFPQLKKPIPYLVPNSGSVRGIKEISFVSWQTGGKKQSPITESKNITLLDDNSDRLADRLPDS